MSMGDEDWAPPPPETDAGKAPAATESPAPLPTSLLNKPPRPSAPGPKPAATPAQRPATAAPASQKPASDQVRAAVAALRERCLGLHRQGDLEETVKHYRRYLKVAPRDHAIWSNLGAALRSLSKFEAAVAAQHRALELQPKSAGYWSNLGNVYKDLDRVKESVEAHDKAVKLDPRNPSWIHHRAVAKREAGMFKESLEDFDVAIRLAPKEYSYRWDRAVVLLHLEDFEEGWMGYEWRYRLDQAPPKRAKVPRWLGEEFKGKRLVIHPEQGFGDTILSTRFLPEVKRRGGEVVLLAKTPLLRLFDGIEGVDKVMPIEDPAPPMHYACSLLDLPRILEITDKNMPPLPRLNIPDQARAKAKAILGPAGDRFKVGVIWSGSVTFKNNRKRSSSAERFLEFGEVPGIQMVSLQKGPREDELDTSGAAGIMLDAGRLVNDFSETAAVIEELDLVIMTDSSVAHLCGCLRKPIWNLLNYVPYWMYGWGTEDTYWYPSMKLIRQPDANDWDSVFERVKKDLAVAVQSKKDGTWPKFIE
ncbi:MAG: tetratricopeptide repeat protein [Pseudomonadota bacterium]